MFVLVADDSNRSTVQRPTRHRSAMHIYLPGASKAPVGRLKIPL